MKKFLKWAAIIVGILAVAAFIAFLYLIPPFSLVPPEEFTKQAAAAPPQLDGIADPTERAIAERGRYIVTTHDCSGCHTPLGDEGPKWAEYLAGGNTTTFREFGTFTTRNLTPDKETGLARRSNDEVLRVLRSGLLPEGRVAHYRDMPWAFYSNFTEEERYAVMVYLRHLKPIYHKIPDDNANTVTDDPSALETFYGKDAAGHQK